MTKYQQQRSVWRSTVRIVAVGLLLFAFTDLSFPQVCQEESGSLLIPSSGATSVTGAAREAAPDRAPLEDCFCCCSHVETEPFAAPHTAALVSASNKMLPPRIPSAPTRMLFHPPRLA